MADDRTRTRFPQSHLAGRPLVHAARGMAAVTFLGGCKFGGPELPPGTAYEADDADAAAGVHADAAPGTDVAANQDGGTGFVDTAADATATLDAAGG